MIMVENPRTKTFGEKNGLLVEKPCERRDCSNKIITDVEVGYTTTQGERVFVADSFCAECQKRILDSELVLSELTKHDTFIPV